MRAENAPFEHSLGTCCICGKLEWTIAHQGSIRKGVFGDFEEAIVYRCSECGVEVLPSSLGDVDKFYRTSDYREAIGQEAKAEAYLRRHDAEAFEKASLLSGVSLRGATVVDVGCGGGSFLDTIRGLVRTSIAVEPAASYHDSLNNRGHLVFSSLEEAGPQYEGEADLVTCFSVIEHVEKPLVLLQGCRRLLKPDGLVLLSTPNRKDLLLEIGPDSYRQFWYRRVHLFYFDERSLRRAAQESGYSRVETEYRQRYGFSNFTEWLRSGKPTGHGGQAPLGQSFDRVWKRELEERGRSDYLYAFLYL